MEILYHSPDSDIALKQGECRQSYYCPPITEIDYNMPICFAKLGIRKIVKPIFRDATYPCLELNVVTEGSVILNLFNKEYIINPGQGFIVNPSTPYSFRPVNNEPWSVYFLSFEGRLKEDFCRYKNSTFSVIDMDKFLDTFYDLATLPIYDDWSYISSEIAYSFLINLDRIFAFPQDPKFSERIKLETVIQYIRSHLDEPYDAEKLASLINVSSSYMCRLFNRVYGMRPAVRGQEITIILNLHIKRLHSN